MTQPQQLRSETRSAVLATLPEPARREPALYTVHQFAEIEPAFTQAALRNLIFKAEPRQSSKGPIPGNGLIEYGAIIRTGRKVMIHRERFLAWVQK